MTAEELKDELTKLGVKYAKNASIEKLTELYEAAKETENETNDEQPVTKEVILSDRTKARNEQLKLVRIVLHPNNPDEAQHESVLISVSNGLIGTVRRVIPFSNEEGWHVEKCIVDTLKEKQFQMFVSKKDSKGVTQVTTKLVPAYNIIELPPLTEEELKKLADTQVARSGI